jgi:hypothetical protein
VENAAGLIVLKAGRLKLFGKEQERRGGQERDDNARGPERQTDRSCRDKESFFQIREGHVVTQFR